MHENSEFDLAIISARRVAWSGNIFDVPIAQTGFCTVMLITQVSLKRDIAPANIKLFIYIYIYIYI